MHINFCLVWGKSCRTEWFRAEMHLRKLIKCWIVPFGFRKMSQTESFGFYLSEKGKLRWLLKWTLNRGYLRILHPKTALRPLNCTFNSFFQPFKFKFLKKPTKTSKKPINQLKHLTQNNPLEKFMKILCKKVIKHYKNWC